MRVDLDFRPEREDKPSFFAIRLTPETKEEWGLMETLMELRDVSKCKMKKNAMWEDTHYAIFFEEEKGEKKET